MSKFAIKPMVGMILVNHERTSSLNLTFKDGIPELLSRNHFACMAFLFILLVQCFKLLAMNFVQIGCFIRAEQRPFAISFDPLHAKRMYQYLDYPIENEQG